MTRAKARRGIGGMVRLPQAGAFLLMSTFARTLPVTVHSVREGEALCISRNRHCEKSVRRGESPGRDSAGSAREVGKPVAEQVS
jgi:hypothetical protein